MVILGRDRLSDFSNRHKEAKKPLDAWEQLIKANTFAHFAQLRQTFGSADYVRPETVFDIGGNKYRIIAVVNYATKTVLVKQVLTHKEYDKRRT